MLWPKNHLCYIMLPLKLALWPEGCGLCLRIYRRVVHLNVGEQQPGSIFLCKKLTTIRGRKICSSNSKPDCTLFNGEEQPIFYIVLSLPTPQLALTSSTGTPSLVLLRPYRSSWRSGSESGSRGLGEGYSRQGREGCVRGSAGSPSSTW